MEWSRTLLSKELTSGQGVPTIDPAQEEVMQLFPLSRMGTARAGPPRVPILLTSSSTPSVMRMAGAMGLR